MIARCPRTVVPSADVPQARSSDLGLARRGREENKRELGRRDLGAPRLDEAEHLQHARRITPECRVAVARMAKSV
jgi:hypothetical protein